MVIAVTGLNRGENPQPGAAVITSLRREFGNLHRIIGLVYDPLESGIFADDGPDAVYTLPYPSAGAEPFLQRLAGIIKEDPVDVIIPCLDAEIEPMVRLRSQLKKMRVDVTIPTRDAFEARNKHHLVELAEECDVRTPDTWAVNSKEDIDEALQHLSFPLLVKGRYYGAKKAHSRVEVDQHFQDLIVEWGAPVLLQRIVHGEEYNLVGICSKPGRIAGWSAIKKTVVNSQGKGFGGVTVIDPVLLETAEKIMNHLKWTGPFELEVLREINGQYSIIEINPRFPAWVNFPSMMGVNLPAALIHELEGEPSSLPVCPAGKLFLRHSIELCCDLQEVGTLSATGCLKHIK